VVVHKTKRPSLASTSGSDLASSAQPSWQAHEFKGQFSQEPAPDNAVEDVPASAIAASLEEEKKRSTCAAAAWKVWNSVREDPRLGFRCALLQAGCGPSAGPAVAVLCATMYAAPVPFACVGQFCAAV
jgi:hypothetical protein